MIKVKLNEIYLYLSVFVVSMIIFFVFFIMTSQTAHTEQTYEMTDHKITTEHKEQNNNQLQQDLNSEQASNQTMAVIK